MCVVERSPIEYFGYKGIFEHELKAIWNSVYGNIFYKK